MRKGLPEKVTFEQMFARCAGVSNRDGRGTPFVPWDWQCVDAEARACWCA